MLALDAGEEIATQGCRARQPRDDSGVRWPESRERARERVAFAGFDFELGGDAREAGAASGVAGANTPHERDAISNDALDTPAPKFAASCRLQMVPPPVIERPLPRCGLAWEWTAEGGELVTSFAGARVRGRASAFEAGAELTADAWLAPDALAPHFLLGGLAVMLSSRLGGGVLHAASVELDGGVVAFVGPSGAGKSTACRHMEGAALVSVDRLAVVPVGSTWLSHPLPGGTRPVPDMPNAAPRWRPLRAVLRVHPSANGTRIDAPAPALAVTSLRESTFQSGLGPSAEEELLDSLEHLVQHVPVARLGLQLGASLKPLLRRWLESQAKDRR